MPKKICVTQQPTRKANHGSQFSNKGLRLKKKGASRTKKGHQITKRGLNSQTGEPVRQGKDFRLQEGNLIIKHRPLTILNPEPLKP